jgi:hypothetical protein
MNSIEYFGAQRETLSAPLALPKTGKTKIPCFFRPPPE